MTNGKLNICFFVFAFLSLIFVVRDFKKSNRKHNKETLILNQKIDSLRAERESLEILNDSLKTQCFFMQIERDSLSKKISVNSYKITKVKKQLSNVQKSDFLFYPDSVVLDILSNTQFDSSNNK